MTSANFWSESTYFTRLREWGIETGFRDLSTLGGSSQQATPSTQPDTPWEPTTPLEDNPKSGKDNSTQKACDETQYMYQNPLPAPNKTPATLPPQHSLRKDISSHDSPPPLRMNPSIKIESSQDKESGVESHASDYSMDSGSTVVSDLQVAIDEKMSNWEPTGPIHIASDVQPTFEHVKDNSSGHDEDVVMEEAEDIRHPRPFHDSGIADVEPTSMLEDEQSNAKIVLMPRDSMPRGPSKKSRSRIPRPKPIPGGPNPLVDVALQTLPQQPRSPVKLFAKSVENLRLISKLQKLQTGNVPPLHQLAASIYDQDVDSMMYLMESQFPQCKDVLMLDEEGNTAGHVALSSPLYLHRPEFPTLWWITTWLGSSNDGIDSRNAKGETILHCAAKNGYKLVVKELLDRGADPNAIDNSRRSVIQVCHDALQEEGLRMMAAGSTSVFEEARGAKSARLYDCARLLRHPRPV